MFHSKMLTVKGEFFFQDMIKYFYDDISATMAQHELLYSLDPRCPHLANTSVFLNDFFPSVTYGPGTASDDKSYPVKIFHYRAPPKCPPGTSDEAMRMLTVMAFAASGEMKTKTSHIPWKTIVDTDLAEAEELACDAGSSVFEYVRSDTDVVDYLLVHQGSKEFASTFLVSNQRLGLYENHGLKDANFTLEIRVAVRSLSLLQKNLAEIANAELYREIFLTRKGSSTELGSKRFYRWKKPRFFLFLHSC